MNAKSIMGYAANSPYRNNPYLDIETPTGEITMENTPVDLLGVDNFGNAQVMKAGTKNPYRFEGDVVTEIPLEKGGLSPSKAREMLRDGTAHGKELTAKQKRYFGWVAGGKKNRKKKQLGGFTSFNDVYKYLFDDDDEEDYKQEDNTAPDVQEVENDEVTNRRKQQDDENYNLALNIAMEERTRRSPGNPYRTQDIPQLPTANYNIKPTTNYSGKMPARAQRADYAFEYYKQKGLAPHIAAGIVGNLMQESGNFREDVIQGKYKGDAGKATGIAQWHPDRFGRLKKWAEATGRNPYTLEAQLDYVLEEPGEGQRALAALQGTKTSAEAANLFAKLYERPKIIDPNRAKYARQLHPYQKGGVYTIPYGQLLEIKKKGYKFKLI